MSQFRVIVMHQGAPIALLFTPGAALVLADELAAGAAQLQALQAAAERPPFGPVQTSALLTR